ncbi:MAG: DUF1499 domain-containing protein [Oceanococcus sp.]
MKTGLTAVMAMSLLGCAGITEHRTGLDKNQQFYPCPEAPRCVSSQQAAPDRTVEPLRLRNASSEVWQTMIAVLADWPRCEVVEQNGRYVRAEITSPWRFYTDDVELLRRPNNVEVDIRSTGRIGHYDFNVNQDRVDALREKWRDAGVLAK